MREVPAPTGMRLALALAAALLLAGCASFSSSSSSHVSSSTETIHEGTLALGPEPRASGELTFEVPANTSWLDVELAAENALNLRAEGPGCATGSGANVQAAVAGRQTATMRCDAPAAGPFTITVSRDAGAGDVAVVVTGQVTRTS